MRVYLCLLFIFSPTLFPSVVYMPFPYCSSFPLFSFSFSLPLLFPFLPPLLHPRPPAAPSLLPLSGSCSALSAPPQRRVSSSSRGCPPAAPFLPTYYEEQLLPPAHKSQVHVTSSRSEHFPGPLLWEPPEPFSWILRAQGKTTLLQASDLLGVAAGVGSKSPLVNTLTVWFELTLSDARSAAPLTSNWFENKLLFER